MALVYQTLFPVNRRKTLDDLARVMTVWIAGSPHRNTTVPEIKNIGVNGFKFEKEHVSIESIRHEEGTERFYGVRLVERTNAIRTTEVVGNTCSAGFSVSVIHEYEAQKIGNVCMKMSKPRIVTDLIRELGGGMDGTILYTSTTPFELKEGDEVFVEEIITNQSDNKLPVIYVSKNNLEQTIVSPQKIALTLAGMAHVLVEPSRKFSFELNKLTNGSNTYNGAIGIYWPNGMKRRILPGAESDIEQVLYDSIDQCALHAVIPQKSSYDGIAALHAARQLELLKSSRDQETAKAKDAFKQLELSGVETAEKLRERDEYLAYADSEVKLLQQQKGISEKQIRDLETKLMLLGQRLAQTSTKKNDLGEILKAPQMFELYTGEITDMVVDALLMYVNHVSDQSRRQDIIQAIIDLNPQTGQYTKKCDGVDSAFRSTPGDYTPKLGNLLRALGLNVVEGKNYPTVSVPGHEGRQVSISKTPSDTQRTRKNESTRVKRDLL